MSSRADTSHRLSRVLRLGVWLGSGLLLVGSILGLVRGDLHSGLGVGHPGLHALATELHFDAATILRFGLLLIIATPVIRVVVAGFLLGRNRDRLAVVCTVAVLGLLAVAIALDLRHL